MHLKELKQKSFGVYEHRCKRKRNLKHCSQNIGELEDELKSMETNQDNAYGSGASIEHGVDGTLGSTGMKVLDPFQRKSKGISTSRF